jgi:glutamate synthase (NADPH/NADH) small chain
VSETPAKVKNNPLPNKERIKLPRQRVPEQDASVRAHNFQEVNLGFPPEQAREESLRCIECPKPGCSEKCPVSVDVRAVIDLILANDFVGAAAKVREDNALPAITGRVCPVEDQCESGCVLGKKGEPVGIAYLERFVADWERESGHFGIPKSATPTGKKVGIVGGGPAGLACAGDLIQNGA